MDDLIERLRARAADPARRNDAPRPTAGSTFVALDLGGLSGGLSRLSGALERVVRANQAGAPIPAADLEAVDHLVTPAAPVDGQLPAPAPEATLLAAEQRLGRPIPAELRRVWAEVADGGFGPGGGLASVASSLARHEALRAEPLGRRGERWPDHLLPIVLYDLDCDAVDLESGAVVAWDVEAAWSRAFQEIAPSVSAWLAAWVGEPSAHERLEAGIDAAMIEQARAARAHIATLSPAERAAMGLPEVGWEREVWGGLGLDEA
jgi:hypothetical protein